MLSFCAQGRKERGRGKGWSVAAEDVQVLADGAGEKIAVSRIVLEVQF